MRLLLTVLFPALSWGYYLEQGVLYTYSYEMVASNVADFDPPFLLKTTGNLFYFDEETRKLHMIASDVDDIEYPYYITRARTLYYHENYQSLYVAEKIDLICGQIARRVDNNGNPVVHYRLFGPRIEYFAPGSIDLVNCSDDLDD